MARQGLPAAERPERLTFLLVTECAPDQFAVTVARLALEFSLSPPRGVTAGSLIRCASGTRIIRV